MPQYTMLPYNNNHRKHKSGQRAHRPKPTSRLLGRLLDVGAPLLPFLLPPLLLREPPLLLPPPPPRLPLPLVLGGGGSAVPGFDELLERGIFFRPARLNSTAPPAAAAAAAAAAAWYCCLCPLPAPHTFKNEKKKNRAEGRESGPDSQEEKKGKRRRRIDVWADKKITKGGRENRGENEVATMCGGGDSVCVDTLIELPT